MKSVNLPDKDTYFLEVCISHTFRKEVTREEMIEALNDDKWEKTGIYNQQADVLIDWIAVDDVIL